MRAAVGSVLAERAAGTEQRAQQAGEPAPPPATTRRGRQMVCPEQEQGTCPGGGAERIADDAAVVEESQRVSLRLSFSLADEERLDEGVKRLAATSPVA